MSESSRPFRHTPGEWQKHPDYDFKPMAVADDNGECWVSCTVHISTAEKKIIGSAGLHHGSDAGYPHVDNLIEMKANLALMSAGPNLLESQTMGADKTTPEMLDWVADRLVFKGDDPGADFIISLRARAEAGRKAIAKATTY